jgi:diguanylate cyclase (GGDEF)-like protein
MLSAAVPAQLESLALRSYVEVFEDTGRQLTFQQVASPDFEAKFEPVAGSSDLNFGFTDSAYWLRIRLKSAANAPLASLIEIAYPALDRVDFYADLNGAPVTLSSGYTLPFSSWPFVHRQLVFPVTLSPGTDTTVYLRVVSRSSLTVPVTLWSPGALHASDQRTYSILSLYFGMLLALGTYNLLLYLSLRDSIYLMYVAFLASLAISQAGILGLTAQFLWPDWPRGGDLIRPAGYCLVGLFGALFSRRLLGMRDWAPRLDQLLRYVQMAFLLVAAGALITDWPFFTIAATLFGAAFSFGAVGIGLLAVKKRVPLAALYLGGSMMLLIGASAFSLRMMGWVPTNFLTSNGMLIGSFFEMLLLSLSMANRIQGLQRSEVALKQLAHHDPLTGLANRTQLTLQIQQAVARSRRDNTQFAVLMLDLNGFKPINDRFGHAVGDQLLIEIGQRLRAGIRSTDVAARVGGDEFIVLVDAVTSLDHARAIADKLVLQLSQPVQVGDLTVRVGASVGIALFPLQSEDIDRLLELADEDMYRAKAMARERRSSAAATERLDSTSESKG